MMMMMMVGARPEHFLHVLAGESWRSEASGLYGGWLDE